MNFFNQRKLRGLNQRLYLVESIDRTTNMEKEYVIMGSTGNVYNVVIKNEPICTCPDYKQRKNRCKHIYFVLIKIMNVKEPDMELYDNDELKKMFKRIPQITNFLKVSDDIKKSYDKLKNKKITQKDLNDSCPICLDDLSNGEKLITCRYSCGRHVHELCFQMYNKNKENKECLYCKHSLDLDTYINLAN